MCFRYTVGTIKVDDAKLERNLSLGSSGERDSPRDKSRRVGDRCRRYSLRAGARSKTKGPAARGELRWSEEAVGWRGSGRDLAVSPEESALLDALRRGDEGAFARLVGEYHASLRRVARLYVATSATADEVVQDTWLGVIRGIWAFEGRSSLKTWILRILVNGARTRAVRESRTAPFAGTLSTESGAGPEPWVSPEHSFPGDDSPAPGHWTGLPLDPGSSPARS